MALWTPANAELPPAHWLEAYDAATLILDGSDGAEQMGDKTTGAKHATQATAGLRPILLADQLGTDPALDFAGTRRMVHTYANPQNRITLFAVVSVNTSDGYRGIYSTNGAGSTAQTMMLARGGTNNWGTFSGSYRQSNSNIQGAGWQILCMRRSGAAGEFFRNGLADGTFAASEGQSGHVGGIPEGGQEFNGKLAATLVYPDELADAEMRKTEGYFAHRLGLAASLPAEHPYKIAAPTYGIFHGTVIDKDGNPAERRISVLDATGHCVATDTSDPVTGAYSIVTVVPAESPHTLVFDGEPDRNAQVFANVIPGEPPA